MKNKMVVSMLGATLLLTACSKNEIPSAQVKDSQSTQVQSQNASSANTQGNEKLKGEDKVQAHNGNHSEKKADKNSSHVQNSEHEGKEERDHMSSSSPKHEKLSLSEAKIKPQEAFAAYQQLYPNSKVDSFALKEKDNQLVYDLEGYDSKNEYHVLLDANRKAVLKQETETVGQKQGKEITAEDLAKLDSFIKKSLSDAGQGYFATEYEIDFNDGIKVVSIQLDASGKEDVKYVFNHQTEQLLERDK